jgi:hypothetical protein
MCLCIHIRVSMHTYTRMHAYIYAYISASSATRTTDPYNTYIIFYLMGGRTSCEAFRLYTNIRAHVYIHICVYTAGRTSCETFRVYTNIRVNACIHKRITYTYIRLGGHHAKPFTYRRGHWRRNHRLLCGILHIRIMIHIRDIYA